MTSTTERPVAPWPTRREREGGPIRRATSAARAAAELAAERVAVASAADGPVAAHPVADRPVGARPDAAAASPATDRPVAACTVLPERRAYVPRHAAAEPVTIVPDVTERLPIVVPAQRSAEVRPTPPSLAGSGTAHPSPRPHRTPVPRPSATDATTTAGAVAAPVTESALTPIAATPVPEPAVARPAPHPTPWRPTHTPCPPRPAVGSAVHDVRPTTGPARNGLGVAAVCLGAVGLPLGLVPVTAFVAAGFGVLALVFGVAGWARVRSGTASNRGTAVTGAVLGLIALGLGVAGTVAFVRAPDRLVYDLDSISTSWSGATAVTPAGE